MKEQQLREIEITDREIITKPSEKASFRKQVYNVSFVFYLLIMVAVWLWVENGSHRGWILLSLGFVSMIFQWLYPRENEKESQGIEMEYNSIKRKPAFFPTKARFNLEQIMAVKTSQIDIELGRTVWINYGIMQNRHDLIDSLSLEDAEKVKGWVKDKITNRTQ
jgi:hypothetical protein